MFGEGAQGVGEGGTVDEHVGVEAGVDESDEGDVGAEGDASFMYQSATSKPARDEVRDDSRVPPNASGYEGIAAPRLSQDRSP